MFTHIAVVRDLVDTQYKEYQEVRLITIVTACVAFLRKKSHLPRCLSSLRS